MNHIIDPTFFYDAIEMYSFDYDAYIVVNVIRDEYGMQKSQFSKVTIRGSLQTQGLFLNQRSSGNTVSNQFKFYCKSLYRLQIGDFIQYGDKLLHVTNMVPYDEYGVREATLEMTQLNEHQDLLEYIKFITGERIV